MKFNFIFKISDGGHRNCSELAKAFYMTPFRPPQDWAKWLARFPKASIILMTAQRGNLRSIMAAVDVERFLTLRFETGRTHVAKTD